MFQTTGVGFRCFRADTQEHEAFFDETVAVIDVLCHLSAFVRQQELANIADGFNMLTARLTLGLEKPNSVATSTERAMPFLFSNIKMVSR